MLTLYRVDWMDRLGRVRRRSRAHFDLADLAAPLMVYECGWFVSVTRLINTKGFQHIAETRAAM